MSLLRCLLLLCCLGLLRGKEPRGPLGSHSLRYLFSFLSEPLPGAAQYSVVGYVDDVPIIGFTSESRRAGPRAPWMEKVTDEEPQYWDERTVTFQEVEMKLSNSLRDLMEQKKQPPDAHVPEVCNRSQSNQDLVTSGHQESWLNKFKVPNTKPGGVSLQVFQPNYINVTVGDTVVLQCSYNSSGNSSQGRYNWFFTNAPSSSSLREIEVSNTSQQFSGRVFNSDHTIVTSQQEANIEIHNVRHDDTGTYVCAVELFMVMNVTGCGNGTRLLVLEDPHTPGPSPPWYSMPLYVGACAVSLLVVAVVVAAALRRRKRGRTETPGQSTNQTQGTHRGHMQYASLHFKEGKKNPQLCRNMEHVVYADIETSVQPGVSKRPAPNEETVQYTMVHAATSTKIAHHRREMPSNVVYAKMPLDSQPRCK